MPDIGIAVIETCLKSLEELPHEDAMAALSYIKQRLQIKERKRQEAAARGEPEPPRQQPPDEWDTMPSAKPV